MKNRKQVSQGICKKVHNHQPDLMLYTFKSMIPKHKYPGNSRDKVAIIIYSKASTLHD